MNAVVKDIVIETMSKLGIAAFVAKAYALFAGLVAGVFALCVVRVNEYHAEYAA